MLSVTLALFPILLYSHGQSTRFSSLPVFPLSPFISICRHLLHLYLQVWLLLWTSDQHFRPSLPDFPLSSNTVYLQPRSLPLNPFSPPDFLISVSDTTKDLGFKNHCVSLAFHSQSAIKTYRFISHPSLSQLFLPFHSCCHSQFWICQGSATSIRGGKSKGWEGYCSPESPQPCSHYTNSQQLQHFYCPKQDISFPFTNFLSVPCIDRISQEASCKEGSLGNSVCRIPSVVSRVEHEGCRAERQQANDQHSPPFWLLGIHTPLFPYLKF